MINVGTSVGCVVPNGGATVEPKPGAGVEPNPGARVVPTPNPGARVVAMPGARVPGSGLGVTRSGLQTGRSQHGLAASLMSMHPWGMTV